MFVRTASSASLYFSTVSKLPLLLQAALNLCTTIFTASVVLCSVIFRASSFEGGCLVIHGYPIPKKKVPTLTKSTLPKWFQICIRRWCIFCPDIHRLVPFRGVAFILVNRVPSVPSWGFSSIRSWMVRSLDPQDCLWQSVIIAIENGH